MHASSQRKIIELDCSHLDGIHGSYYWLRNLHSQKRFSSLFVELCLGGLSRHKPHFAGKETSGKTLNYMKMASPCKAQLLHEDERNGGSLHRQNASLSMEPPMMKRMLSHSPLRIEDPKADESTVSSNNDGTCPGILGAFPNPQLHTNQRALSPTCDTKAQDYLSIKHNPMSIFQQRRRRQRGSSL